MKTEATKLKKETKLKNHYYQLDQSIENIKNIRLVSNKYGDRGCWIYIKIEIYLLTNDGIGDIDWMLYSTRKKDKEVIEYIMDLHIDNGDGTFSSLEVNRQLEVRKGAIEAASEKGRQNATKRWNKKIEPKPVLDYSTEKPENKNENYISKPVYKNKNGKTETDIEKLEREDREYAADQRKKNKRHPFDELDDYIELDV